jgi:hypothetical protein
MCVALLALFVALGGTGYAVTKINGSQLVNRSVPAVKVKKDVLTGNEVRESALKAVPLAGNADKLDGRDSTSFLRGDALRAGSANPQLTPARTFFSWPAEGLAVTTDGDNDVDQNVNIVSTGSTPFEFFTSSSSGAAGAIPAGGEQLFTAPSAYSDSGNPSDEITVLLRVNKPASTVRFLVHCYLATGNTLDFCWGMRSAS